MNHGYMPGPEQPDREIMMPRGQAIAGYPIGIIVIDTWYPLVPGNVANASTYEFPVLIKVLKGVSVERILSGDPALLDLVIAAGNELIQGGVRSIVGACGSFAYYQKEAASRLCVPTFLSVMLQVPIILQSLRPDQKLGILAASSGSLTQNVFDQCGITDTSHLSITEALNLPEFQKLVHCTGSFNSHKMEMEVVEKVKAFIADHPEIGAMLIQCSDLTPYAWAIQNATNLAVFDMNTLINWVYQAVVRKPFSGFI